MTCTDGLLKLTPKPQKGQRGAPSFLGAAEICFVERLSIECCLVIKEGFTVVSPTATSHCSSSAKRLSGTKTPGGFTQRFYSKIACLLTVLLAHNQNICLCLPAARLVLDSTLSWSPSFRPATPFQGFASKTLLHGLTSAEFCKKLIVRENKSGFCSRKQASKRYHERYYVPVTVMWS
jgi:hypothetical protein